MKKFNSIKQRVLAFIWGLLVKMDKGQAYRGETAPFCGHAYSGFENKYLETSYNEGEGGGSTKFTVLGYALFYETMSSPEYYIAKVRK